MKAKIHPKYGKCVVTCACGNTFETRSTVEKINVEICGACHPFFTGKQKFVDTAGRVEKFQKRYAWDASKAKGEKAATAAETKPAKAATAVETKPAKAPTAAETKPAKAATAAETKPAKAPAAVETKPAKAAAAAETKPAKA